MKGTALTLKEIGRVKRAMRPLLARYPTQAALARVLGVRQQTVSAALSGASWPGIRFALGVAKATEQSARSAALDAQRSHLTSRVERPPQHPHPERGYTGACPID